MSEFLRDVLELQRERSSQLARVTEATHRIVG